MNGPDERRPETDVPFRRVHCTEARAWLAAEGRIAGASIITSLPDVSELRPMALADWRGWFSETASAVLRACPDDGVAIFFQSDVIVEGVWQDKAALVTRGADTAGAALLFHGIVCREGTSPGHFGRPAFSHMLAFSRGLRLLPGYPRADVRPNGGPLLWSKGVGLYACADACRFVKHHAPSTCIVDPFCGRGTILAVANALGMDAVGVERVPRRAQAARGLQIDRSALDC